MLLNSNNFNEKSSNSVLDEAGFLMALLEAEEFWGSYNLALAKVEHEAIVSENAELLNEAVSDWVEKVKQFFKKLWNAFTSFVKWVWGEIKSVFQKRHVWVKQNKNAILDGARAAETAGKKVTWKLNLAEIEKIDKALDKEISEDSSTREELYENVKDAFNSIFGNDTEESYVTKAQETIKYFQSSDGNATEIKKKLEKSRNDIKKNETNAIKDANKLLRKSESDEESNKLAKKIEFEKKAASFKLKILQLSYSAYKKTHSYYFAFAKKCFTYKTFGRKKPAGENASILNTYK